MTVYSFCSQPDCTDGANPKGGLIQAANLDLYGTTKYGGGPGSDGTIFKINSGGTLTTLHTFCSLPECADGRVPLAGLTQARNGGFYGTTASAGPRGAGTVFGITPSGTLTTLYGFSGEGSCNCAGGDQPQAPLVQAANGNFYGTTVLGGPDRNGTLFQISPSGELATLFSFCASVPCIGRFSQGALIQGTDGNLYGTGLIGGDGYGMVFRLTLAQ